MSELKDQLNKLNERVDELVNNPSELSKDALLGQLRSFYDVVKSTELEAPVKKVSKPIAAVKPVEPTVEKEPEVIPEPVKVVEPKVIVKEVEVPVAEKVDDKVPEPAKEAKEEPIVIAPAAEEKPKTKKEPMIGKEEPVKEDANKKILAGQFNNSPLSDLRSGIPLNEKFGMIKNLFKGNASDFGDAVLKLNNAASSKEMNHYMGLLKQRFSWDENSEAYIGFKGYVERKMMALQPSNADADQ